MPTGATRSPFIPETVQAVRAGHIDRTIGWSGMNSVAHRILVVDDEPCILQVVAKMAQNIGYRTTAVATAMEALHVLSKTFHDVVMTDYDLPWIDGCQLAAQIKAKHPGTRVIIMTDHCEAEITDRHGSIGIVDGLLLKPFNLESMRKKIENNIAFESRRDNGQEFSRLRQRKQQSIPGAAIVR